MSVFSTLAFPVTGATLLKVFLYLFLAPIFGGLVAGADRIISARLQSRVGPPLLQPFYDV
ncbi:MAG: NADH-quinone oxidoreductase subunit H, partial [Oligoflexia bacterium]|nr:NADH-quinone oxidoreductase subunit H [Oligoflexia bacterium]